jgi:hypothetical protein
LKPAQGNSSQDPISKKKRSITKKGLVEWLKVEALSSNTCTVKKKKKKKKSDPNLGMVAHTCIRSNSGAKIGSMVV